MTRVSGLPSMSAAMKLMMRFSLPTLLAALPTALAFAQDAEPAARAPVALLSLEGQYLGHEVDASCRHEGPQILLCAEGSTTVHAKSGSLTLERGMAAWVAADDGPIRFVAREPAELFRVTVGL